MKKHSVNYADTFIEVAEDCPVTAAEEPPQKEPKTAARIEYDLIIENPYRYMSDEVLYESNGRRKGLSSDDFFAKGQPCFRASALTKRYGWGVHSDALGRVALYAVESEAYKRLAQDESLAHVEAMRSSRKP